ncbi:MAG: ABC transporter ATP-binding protein/permease [Clostridiaceae bacterium]|nr:ABC transporter ATP-binding protein/permease [Clostridiaceae bacterium]
MKDKSLLRYQWKKNPAVFMCGLFYVPLGILLGLLRIYLPKAVLAELEAGQTAAHMGMVLLGISAALLLLLLLQTRLEVRIARYGYLLLQGMRQDYAKHLLTVDYEEIENPKFRSARDQAKQAIYGGRMDGKNISPVNDYMKELLAMAANMGSTLLYLVMIARISPMLIPVLLLPPILILYLDSKTGAREMRNWDAVADAAQKETYTRKRAGDFTYAKDIRLYNMKPWLLGMNEKYAGIRLGYKKQELTFTGGLAVANNVIHYAQIACICGFFLYRAWNGQMTVSDVVLYFGAASAMMASFLTMSQKMVILRLMNLTYRKFADFVDCENCGDSQTIASLEQNGVFDEKAGCGQGDGKEQLPEPAAWESGVTLELKSVSYRFPGADRDVLHDLNLTVKSGERIAVVGLNGAGKTTLMKLLCGLLTPTAGQILLNGVDMREMLPEKRYAWFACAFQDIGFLPVSVRENIICGMQENDARLMHCLEQAGIKEKLLSLPNGADTLMEKDINEDAVDFSGGEKQKLVLARALYQDRPILILDEPTAALDPLAEYEMYRHYSDFAKNKLSFFVSHRLSSTRFCTRILLLQDGCFAEQGTHEELLAKKGMYAKLFQMQSFYYREQRQ